MKLGSLGGFLLFFLAIDKSYLKSFALMFIGIRNSFGGSSMVNSAYWFPFSVIILDGWGEYSML